MTEVAFQPTVQDGAHERSLLVPVFFLVLSLLLCGLFLLDLKRGPIEIPASALARLLFGSGSANDSWGPILFQIRLPRAVAATFAGAALASSGLLLQTIFRNPLAGPWAVGVNAGAQVGVAMVTVAGGAVAWSFLHAFTWVGRLTIVTGAYVGSAVTLALVLAASRRLSSVALLVLGLIGTFVAEGLVNIILHFTNEVQIKVYQSWNAGSYSGLSLEDLRYFVPLIAASLLLVLLLPKKLDALLLGERYAQSLGVAVLWIRRGVLLLVVLLAGTVTAFCGPITFIDIAVPHLCRGLFRTSSHRILLPATMLAGGVIGLVGDLLASAPWERHFLHVNAVNAVVGGPVIIWVVMRSRALSSMEA